ncbi:SgcJ/EcaC family oxidoreductase [uncultured Kriegella sp.]|uniref:YybH family protein n=1 Tax=uncultured Kriegella sp. TaxID=1798910 RepID=UPI0030DB7C05|tara:strand:+ start:41785 stop:42240 length:456 start_codon:yes stop_codon:yes gene_type:complete
MKKQLIWVSYTILLLILTGACAQVDTTKNEQEKAIIALIAEYAQVRETKDTVALKQLLTTEVDQLVSTGEWRRGKKGALEGMMRSSNSNPGGRTLAVEHIRFLNDHTAIADARYEIQNSDGNVRKMWSTFIVISEEGRWKITAIRNMLPKR